MLWKGRGQSSCRYLQLSGSLEWPKAENTNGWHGAQEISTFHQKDGGSWMACDKSYYWIISDFQELVAMVQADCIAFTIYISFPTLFFQQEVRFWKEDNVFSGFICILNMANGVSICGCERGEFHPGLEVISSIYPVSEHSHGAKVQALMRLGAAAISFCHKRFGITLLWFLPARLHVYFLFVELLRGNFRHKRIKAHLPPSPHYVSSQATLDMWKCNLIKMVRYKRSMFWPYGQDMPCTCSCVQLGGNPCTDPQQAGGISCPTWPGKTLWSPTVELKDVDSTFDLKLLMHP